MLGESIKYANFKLNNGEFNSTKFTFPHIFHTTGKRNSHLECKNGNFRFWPNPPKIQREILVMVYLCAGIQVKPRRVPQGVSRLQGKISYLAFLILGGCTQHLQLKVKNGGFISNISAGKIGDSFLENSSPPSGGTQF